MALDNEFLAAEKFERRNGRIARWREMKGVKGGWRVCLCGVPGEKTGAFTTRVSRVHWSKDWHGGHVPNKINATVLQTRCMLFFAKENRKNNCRFLYVIPST